mgnify:CR=1 FL=1
MSILTVDFRAENAKEQFARSMRETGFVVLRNHPVHWPLVEEVYADWLTFFESDEKFDYLHDNDKQEGYVTQSIAEVAKGASVKDIKEFYQLYFPWGRYPKSLSGATRQLFQEMYHLGSTLLEWVEETLPEDVKADFRTSLKDALCLERTQFRMLHYPAFSGKEEKGAIRAAAHEDINLITVLPAGTQPGLEARDLSGEWHAVKVDPETIVINAGDMLQEMTKGYIVSTTHRVVNPEESLASEPRMSMPLFMHPTADTYLSERYPTAEDYLDERLKEIGTREKAEES